jgi:hypothetical protein
VRRRACVCAVDRAGCCASLVRTAVVAPHARGRANNPVSRDARCVLVTLTGWLHTCWVARVGSWRQSTARGLENSSDFDLTSHQPQLQVPLGHNSMRARAPAGLPAGCAHHAAACKADVAVKFSQALLSWGQPLSLTCFGASLSWASTGVGMFACSATSSALTLDLRRQRVRRRCRAPARATLQMHATK